MGDNIYTKTLKTPSPPAKLKLYIQSFDSYNKNSITSSAKKNLKENLLNEQNNQLTCNIDDKNQTEKTFEIPQELEKTDLGSQLITKPSSTESQRNNLTCRSILNNTGDALTGIVKKYRELQARSKISLVLDDSSDEEENSNNLDLQTPSFRCSTDEESLEEEQCSSQYTNSLESNSNSKQMKKDSRLYKSEPGLSSFENSGDQSVNNGMYQDSLRYHSQTLKKAEKVFETVIVSGKNYYVLNVLGEGGSSKVFQVCDSEKNEFYALKVVDLSKADENLKSSLKKEIEILNMLKGCKRVIQLYSYEFNKKEEKLMFVMEKGDSDLSTVLTKMIQNDKKKGLDLYTIKHYWNEMLKAVDEIHSKGVVHSDLKPVNFVIVKGYLKLIDFGIADAINPDHTSVIKNTLVGTINFMSPESLMGRPNAQILNGKKIIKVNCKSDVWSLGCILYNMVYGKTPFGHIDQIYDKINAICNPKTVINYGHYENQDAIDCIKRCLVKNPHARPSVAELFHHPFLSREKINKSNTLSAKIPVARNTMLDKKIFDDVNSLTPRSFSKFKTVVKKELSKMKK